MTIPVAKRELALAICEHLWYSLSDKQCSSLSAEETTTSTLVIDSREETRQLLLTMCYKKKGVDQAQERESIIYCYYVLRFTGQIMMTQIIIYLPYLAYANMSDVRVQTAALCPHLRVIPVT